MPLGFFAATAHAGAVYAMTAGAVSFGQIVKAGEPVFAAIVGYLAYNSKVSMAKILCLIPVIGGVGNAYALTTLWATLLLIPMIFISGEYAKFDEFKKIWAADGKAGTVGNLKYNTIMSGLTFYLYNEVSTMALKSLSGVSHSVANTAKRAVVIVGSAIAFNESMDTMKQIGCATAIGGTFLYAIADDIPKMLGMGGKAKAS